MQSLFFILIPYRRLWILILTAQVYVCKLALTMFEWLFLVFLKSNYETRQEFSRGFQNLDMEVGIESSPECERDVSLNPRVQYDEVLWSSFIVYNAY